jgi:hypothetical protein
MMTPVGILFKKNLKEYVAGEWAPVYSFRTTLRVVPPDYTITDRCLTTRYERVIEAHARGVR